MEPAAPRRRLLAHLADRALAGVSALAVALCVGGSTVLVLLGTLVVVELLLVVATGRLGTTPGRAAAGIRVVSPQGRPVGVRRALVRALVVIAAGLPSLGLGLAALAWTALTDPSGRRRGLHDRVTGTVVVAARVRPAPVAAPATAPALVDLTALRLGSHADPPIGPVPDPRPPVPSARGAWRLVTDDGAEIDPVRAVRIGAVRLQVAPDGALVAMDDGAGPVVVVRRGHRRRLAPRCATSLVVGDLVEVGDRTLRVDRRG